MRARTNTHTEMAEVLIWCKDFKATAVEWPILRTITIHDHTAKMLIRNPEPPNRLCSRKVPGIITREGVKLGGGGLAPSLTWFRYWKVALPWCTTVSSTFILKLRPLLRSSDYWLQTPLHCEYVRGAPGASRLESLKIPDDSSPFERQRREETTQRLWSSRPVKGVRNTRTIYPHPEKTFPGLSITQRKKSSHRR